MSISIALLAVRRTASAPMQAFPADIGSDKFRAIVKPPVLVVDSQAPGGEKADPEYEGRALEKSCSENALRGRHGSHCALVIVTQEFLSP